MEYYSSLQNYNFLASPDPDSESDSESSASNLSLPVSNMDPIEEDDESYIVGPRMLRARRSKKSIISDSDGDFDDEQVDDVRGSPKSSSTKKQSTKPELRTPTKNHPLPEYDVLLGVWKQSKPEFDMDKMAVYGCFWPNKAVRYQIFKFTTDGRPVDGEFPIVGSRRCPWAKYQDIKLLPKLDHLKEKELKQYVKDSVKQLKGRRQEISQQTTSMPSPVPTTDMNTHPDVKTSPQPEANTLTFIPKSLHSEPLHNELSGASPRSLREASHPSQKVSTAPTTATPDQAPVAMQQESAGTTILTPRTSNNTAMGGKNSTISKAASQNIQPHQVSPGVAADRPELPSTEQFTDAVSKNATVDNQRDEASQPASIRISPPLSTTSSKSKTPEIPNVTRMTVAEAMPLARTSRHSLPLPETQRPTPRIVRSETPNPHSNGIKEIGFNAGQRSLLGKRSRPVEETIQVAQHSRRPPPPSYRLSSPIYPQLLNPEEPYKIPEPSVLDNNKDLPKCWSYSAHQIQEYRRHGASKHQDMSKFNDRHVVLTMLGSLYPALVRENRAMGREVKIPHTSPVPQPTKDFIFSSPQVKAYRSYCFDFKHESTQDLADLHIITIMLGELYNGEAAAKEEAEHKKLTENQARIEETTHIKSPRVALPSRTDSNIQRSETPLKTDNIEVPTVPESSYVSPYNQPDEEGPDGSWIRFKNIIYTRCKEEPLKDKFLAAPYSVTDLGGEPAIEYEMLEVVKKKAVLLHNGFKFQKVGQVPRVVMRTPALKRHKLLLHDSEIEAAAKFVRMDGFSEVGDKWVRSTQIIERIEGDVSDEEDEGKENASDKDARMEVEMQS